MIWHFFICVWLWSSQPHINTVLAWCHPNPEPTCRNVWVCVCVFWFVISNIRVVNHTISVENIQNKCFGEELWNISQKWCSEEHFWSVFLWFIPIFQLMHTHIHTSSIRSPLFILQFSACRHSNLKSELIMLLPSLKFWCSQLLNADGMSSFYLRQREEWLCLRRLGDESVMSKHRFFWGGGDPPPRVQDRLLPSWSNQAWHDLRLPLLSVNSMRTDLWKCLTFSCKTAPGSLSSLKPNQAEPSLFPLCLPSFSALSPSDSLPLSLHFGHHHIYVLAFKN